MAIVKPNNSALIVTAPCQLTMEQVDQVRAKIACQVPIGTVVIVLDPGFTARTLEDTSAMLLGEVRALRSDIAERHAEMSAVGMRVFKE